MSRSEPIGFSLAGGFLVVVGSTVTASLLFSPSELSGRVLIMMIAVCGYAAREIPRSISLATAVMAWLFTTGFLVNAAGELTFGRPDLLRLGLLLLAVALTGGTRTAINHLQAPRPHVPVPLPREESAVVEPVRL